MARDNIDNDKLLIEELIKGNHTSFKKTFELFGPELFEFSFKILKSNDIAEDVVQETFVRIWENRHKLKTEGSFKSFLSTIALNIIRKHFNDMAKDSESRDKLLLSLAKSKDLKEDDPYDILVGKLNELISKMPQKRREVFYANKILGKTAKEIANQYNISVKTVEYHVAEAMKFLKKEFRSITINGLLFFTLFQSLSKIPNQHN